MLALQGRNLRVGTVLGDHDHGVRGVGGTPHGQVDGVERQDDRPDYQQHEAPALEERRDRLPQEVKGPLIHADVPGCLRSRAAWSGAHAPGSAR